ncbi:MAG: ComF family protein [Chitinophagaceae bacterium]|nr:ComF family protein [Chitinophagaceae bacterium]MCW5905614.1 ComF family protein [Chitinophagaceae bacterium]
MLSTLQSYLKDFSHLIFPHYCEGCGTDAIQQHDFLCMKCIAKLPETNFENIPNNPVEKLFYGRLNIQYATAAFYFSKQSLVQHLIHQLKYKSNKEAGIFLGKMLGTQLSKSEKFKQIDTIIPLPLNIKKEIKRGYNQSLVIAEGIATIFNKPIENKAVVRTVFTETQTHNNRINRWKNIDGVFAVANPHTIYDKHVLLVDDIVTTGATIDACGNTIIKSGCKALSIATVACAM